MAERRDWCIAALRKNGVLPADAEIHEYLVTPLNQEIIFRSNACRVEITCGPDRKKLKCFAKFAPTMGTVWNRAIFNLQLNHLKETLFNRHFAQVDGGLPTPRVYYSEMSFFTGNLCLITEFMSDALEYQECTYTHLPQEQLDRAIEGLATLHARYWGDSSKRMKNVLPISDSTVLLFDSLVSRSWSATARRILTLSWQRMNKPETIVHGDSRIGNMIFPASSERGRFVFIDWQAVRRGKSVFDLAYFLNLSLLVEHRRAVEAAAVDAYFGHLQRLGVTNYERAQFDEDYRHACLCVLVLLALPYLSGETSVDGRAAQIFAFGMGVWNERLRRRFETFDFGWVADRYGVTAEQARAAVTEMLTVIDDRSGALLVESGSRELFESMRTEHQGAI